MRHALGPVEGYRACGYRVGWAVFSGALEHAADYLRALELLASLRLCSNVPAQWAVQTALGGYQSIRELRRPGGRLFESRRAILEAVGAQQAILELQRQCGRMYAFIGVSADVLPDFDDQAFAMDLLEQKHVLVAPGSASTSRIAIISGSPICPNRAYWPRCSSASRRCSTSTRKMRPPQSDRI